MGSAITGGTASLITDVPPVVGMDIGKELVTVERTRKRDKGKSHRGEAKLTIIRSRVMGQDRSTNKCW